MTDGCDRESIMRKIQCCLALGTSSNENEAKAALLAARKLMAIYKIGVSELKSEKEDVEEKYTEITFTRRYTPWMQTLAAVIAENHGCCSILKLWYRRQTKGISFKGFSDDLDVCCRVFAFAVSTIYDNLEAWMDLDSKKSYAWGFVKGLAQAYKAQNRENEAYSLVLTVPPEVMESVSSLKDAQEAVVDFNNVDEFRRGVRDGREHLSTKTPLDTHHKSKGPAVEEAFIALTGEAPPEGFI